MNKYVLMLLLLMFSADIKAQLTFGYVDRQAVLESDPEVSQIRQRMERYGDQLRSELDSLNTLQGSLIREYESLKSAGGDRARLDVVQGKLVTIGDRIQMKQNELEGDFQQRQEQLIAPFFKKLERALDEIALENGINVILNKGATPEAFKKALESGDVPDLTRQVTTRLSEYQEP